MITDITDITADQEQTLWFHLEPKSQNYMTLELNLRNGYRALNMTPVRGTSKALITRWIERGVVTETNNRYRPAKMYRAEGEAPAPRPVDTLKGDDRYFTKTETLRRLRVAAKLARAADGDIAANDRVEIGTRAVPVYLTGDVVYGDTNAVAADDDLFEFLSMGGASKVGEVRLKGYVAHLYFSSTVELINTITVWLGDDDHEPVLVHSPKGARA